MPSAGHRWCGHAVALAASVALGTTSYDVCAQTEPSGVESPPTTSPALGTVDDDVPLRYPPSSVRVPLIVGGLAAIAVPYGVGVITSQAWPEAPGSDALYAPVVGPWIALGQSGCAADDPDCGAILYFRGIMHVISGLMQAGGLAIIGEGVFMTTEAESAAEPKKGATSNWTVAPYTTPRGGGLTAFGTF